MKKLNKELWYLIKHINICSINFFTQQFFTMNQQSTYCHLFFFWKTFKNIIGQGEYVTYVSMGVNVTIGVENRNKYPFICVQQICNLCIIAISSQQLKYIPTFIIRCSHKWDSIPGPSASLPGTLTTTPSRRQ